MKFKHGLMAAAITLSGAVSAENVLYTNAQVYTLKSEQPWAQAVLVKDDRITFVGDAESAKKHSDTKTRVVDLKQRVMLPGLIETHAHPVFGSVMASGLMFDPEDYSVESYLQQAKDYIASKPDANVIFGFGFYADSFGPQGPTREMLDKLESKRPVVFLDEGGHSAWANSKAFDLAGIGRDTPDPEPGVHFYRRDASGRPSGHALESQAVSPLTDALGIYNEANVRKQLGQLMPLFPMLGFTAVFEAGMLEATEIGHKVLQSMETAGELKTRMVTSLSLADPKKAGDAVADLQDLKRRYSSELIHPTTLKIHNDGTTEAETSAQLEPFLNDKNNLGGLILSGQKLANTVTAVDAAGFNIHIHSIGDRAVREALDAFAAARKANPNSKQRFSTAHTELVNPVDYSRFAELDVVAQTTPLWFGMEREQAYRILGAERAERLYSFGDVVRSGGKVTFGSDFPVSGGVPGLVPMAQIEAGMTRAMPGAKASSAQPRSASSFSLDAMIRGYTLDAAYQLNMESDIGSIEVGKKADFVILQDNIFEMAPQQIHQAKVYQTILNGELVYQRSKAVVALETELGI